MTSSNLEKIKRLIRQNLEVADEEITAEASFSKDLGADSLDIVELVMDIENEFNLEIPDEATEKFHFVKDLLNYLDNSEK